MSFRLAKNNTPAYDYYSEDGSDPISVSVTLDGLGGEVIGAPANPIYAIFENDTGGIATIEGADSNPAGPLVALQSEEAGINWEVSTDNVTFAESITLANQTVSGGDQVVQIYARCRVTNDGSVLTNNYVAAKIQTLAKQLPA